MLEKDIENLIARYPHEFFPNSRFTLEGQQIRLGTCYADIIFRDEFNRKVIIEVKRGILSREASGQVIEYYGLLKQKEPDSIIELIVCANTIPTERRLFLENIGIECRELGIAAIQKTAEKYGYIFLDEIRDKDRGQKKSAPDIASSPNMSFIENEGGNIWIFQANPNRYDILNALSDTGLRQYHWQINQHIRDIRKGDIALIWMSGKEAGIYAIATIESDPAIIAEPSNEEKYWIQEEDKNVSRLRAILKNRIILLNRPIYREDLKAIEETKDLSIIKNAQGTNFPVTPDEWNVIKDLLRKKTESERVDK